MTAKTKRLTDKFKAYIKSKMSTGGMDRLRFVHGYLCSLFYFGTTYSCPICSGYFRTLLANGRKNALCPRCGSLERHRMIWCYLREKSDLFSNKMKFLHIAPEFCFQRKFRGMSNLDYFSVDLNSSSAMINMDITDMQFEDDSFDGMLCIHVLEHIVDDIKAMREIYRILRPGGWGILHVPIKGDKTVENSAIATAEERMKHYGDPDHVRLYGRDIKDRLTSVGFSVKVIPYLKNQPGNKIRFFRLLPENNKNEDIYLCTKERAGQSV